VRLALPLVLLVAQAVAPPAPVDPEPFVVGVVRRDGLVSPFAAFDGKRWSVPWPADLQFFKVPISLETVPDKWWGKAGAPAELSLWADGVRRGAARLERPAVVRIMCDTRLALKSDYKSRETAPAPTVQPYPKDGLAISGTHPVDAIETVPRTAPEWNAIAMKLVEPADRMETSSISAIPDWKHPFARRERQKIPVELEMLYRAPMDAAGWTAYYVEAIKRYPPGPEDDGCGLVTSVKGWITSGPEWKSHDSITARITYCDRKDVTFVLPLGLIRTRDRNYWVYQLSGYGREMYFVTRPTPREIEPQIFYEAGLCGRP
jgi:hypothetical protein